MTPGLVVASPRVISAQVGTGGGRGAAHRGSDPVDGAGEAAEPRAELQQNR